MVKYFPPGSFYTDKDILIYGIMLMVSQIFEFVSRSFVHSFYFTGSFVLWCVTRVSCHTFCRENYWKKK